MAISPSIRMVFVGAMTALALGGLTAPAAQANGSDNHMDPEACAAQTDAGFFKFTLWYNSSYAGSHRNFYRPVNDFGDEPYGGDDPHTEKEPLYFCPDQGSGSGSPVKNNAASAQNRATGSNSVIFYNSWMRGAQDKLGPMSSWFQLKSTYNNNASFDWR